eukprot:08303_6
MLKGTCPKIPPTATQSSKTVTSSGPCVIYWRMSYGCTLPASATVARRRQASHESRTNACTDVSRLYRLSCYSSPRKCYRCLRPSCFHCHGHSFHGLCPAEAHYYYFPLS